MLRKTATHETGALSAGGGGPFEFPHTPSYCLRSPSGRPLLVFDDSGWGRLFAPIH